jgi:putative oxidoreductase
MDFTFLAPQSARVLSLLRIVAALAFMAHGLMKIFHFPVAQAGAPDPLPTMLLVAGWLEVVGGGLLVLGLFTRPVAFLMSGMMAVAYFAAHAPKSFYPAALLLHLPLPGLRRWRRVERRHHSAQETLGVPGRADPLGQ